MVASWHLPLLAGCALAAILAGCGMSPEPAAELSETQVYEPPAEQTPYVPPPSYIPPPIYTPPALPTAYSPPPQPRCHPSYEGACLRPDASDYDCAGGSGDGPYYTGRVRVVGPDEYGLDRDGDGIGCE